MIDRGFIEGKIDKIKIYSNEIEAVFKFSLGEIRRDFMKYRTMERELQLISDEMIDINNHFIRRMNLEVPDSFQSTFIVLAKNNILPYDFAEKIAPVVGMRNRLVHRYEEINMDLFINLLQKNKDDFREYIKFINEYLNKKF